MVFAADAAAVDKLSWLSDREKTLVHAALSYAYSNADDLNAALAFDVPDDGTVTQIRVDETVTEPLTNDEFEALRVRLFVT